MVSVENQAGQARFFSAERCNEEVQSILVESLAADGTFDLIAQEKDAPALPGNEDARLDALRKMGARLYLGGHLVESDADDGNIRLYLRIIDLTTRKVECATSAEGADLREVARKAAAQLLARIGN